MALAASTWGRWAISRVAISVVALAACGVDDRNPSIAERSPGTGGTDQGDSLQGDSLAAANPQPEGAAGNPRPQGPVGSEPGSGSAASNPSNGLSAGKLVANAESFDFSGLEVGSRSRSFTWVITNTADVPSGALSLSEGAEPFHTQSACPAALPAKSSCNVEVWFAPTSGGPAAGDIQFGSSDEAISLAVTGSGLYRVNVLRVGRGSVTDLSNGLTCSGNSCTGLFEQAAITLSARTENGSGSFFTGWSLAECAAKDDCSFDLDASRSITATFQEQSSNLIFVTSSNYPSNFGGLDALDAECNRVASAAGINSAAGNDFIAAVSSSSASLRQRLGTARGWVRRDGLPVADTLDALFGQLQMMYPAWLTEHGSPSTDLVMTGTDETGAAVPENCNDWTLDAGANYRCGRPEGSPRAWLGGTTLACGGQRTALYCMGIQRSTAVTLVPTSGKRMWVTADAYAPGSVTPDEFCQSHRPTGVAAAVAFVAYADLPASGVLDPFATYVRPDGVVVGRGIDIAQLQLVAGPWVSNDGTNDSNNATWVGARTPNEFATPSQNCNNWTNADGSALLGDSDSSSERFFNSRSATACSQGLALRCVEP